MVIKRPALKRLAFRQGQQPAYAPHDPHVLSTPLDHRAQKSEPLSQWTATTEEDHRFIKRITAPMLGFKAFHSAAATIAGIETAYMIRKGQFNASGMTAFQQLAWLAA